MSSRTLLTIAATCSVVVFGAFQIFTGEKSSSSNKKPVAVQSSEQQCVREACIEITQSDGQKFQLNDFRFVTVKETGEKCILFITFPAGEHKKDCGSYQLQWIGPDNMDQKHGTAIET